MGVAGKFAFGITEQRRQHEDTLVPVAEREFIGRSHSAVELDAFLTQFDSSRAYKALGSGNRRRGSGSDGGQE